MRSGAQPKALCPTSNFAYMRKLHHSPSPLAMGAQDRAALERPFEGMKTEFCDLDGVRPGFVLHPVRSRRDLTRPLMDPDA